MTKVAWIYFGGDCGQDPDKERGFKWFKLAYEAGSNCGRTVVGDYYLRGDGAAKDEDTGIRILLPLANAGVAHALILVGQCHYNVSGPLPIYSACILS